MTPAVAPAPRRASAPRLVTSVEGITEYELANGMRVLLFPDPSRDSFVVNITYLVGSRMEGYGETGMAHLLEHMMFKGTPRHPAVWEELKQRGASNNATTWFDRTNYFEQMQAKGDNLAWALDMEADRMINSNIAQDDLNKEFSVVRNEFEIGESRPEQVLSERMWSTAYLWHNYGKSTIGSRSDIEKVPATSLKRFYKKYYRPDNAILLVAGKLDPAATLAQITRSFGGTPRPAVALEPTYTTEPVQDGERQVQLRRNGDVQAIGLAYHISAAADPDYAAVDALGDILTAEPSGRLYQALVKPGLASSVNASALPLHDPGLIEISASVPAGKSIDAVRVKLLAVVEGLAKTKVLDEELARFKAKAKKQFKQTFANSQSLGIAISEFIAAGDWRLFFVHRDQIERLTTADIQRVAAAYLLPSNRTLGVYTPSKTPERAPQQDTPDVGKIVGDYRGKPAEAEGEKFDATVDNIEHRTQRTTLADGMKLAVLAKQTRGHVVRAKLTLRYGSEAELTGTSNRVAAMLLGEALGRGSKLHTYQQLQDQWDLLEAQVQLGTSEVGKLDVSIQTTREHLAAVLALVDEVLRQPAFPQDQLDIMVKEQLTALDDQKSAPQVQAFLAVNRALSPYPASHPRYLPTTEEQITGVKALKAADLRKLAAMLGTSAAQLTIVGDVDPAVSPWIERTWGSWASRKPFKRIERKLAVTSGAEQLLDFADKANSVIALAQGADFKDDDADAPAMAVGDFMLGGGGFASRLTARLRQKDGLSYFSFSALRLDAFDAAGSWLAAAGCAPQNVKKAMAAAVEVIAGLVDHGITAGELATAKQGLVSDFDRNLTSDGFVLDRLHDGLYTGRTLAFWAKRNAAITALTLDQTNAVIKRRLKPASLVRITAGDKAKM
ncbi:MAG TPA: insulinase family protein [Kofleriaceae bacterium]